VLSGQRPQIAAVSAISLETWPMRSSIWGNPMTPWHVAEGLEMHCLFYERWRLPNDIGVPRG